MAKRVVRLEGLVGFCLVLTSIYAKQDMIIRGQLHRYVTLAYQQQIRGSRSESANRRTLMCTIKGTSKTTTLTVLHDHAVPSPCLL